MQEYKRHPEGGTAKPKAPPAQQQPAKPQQQVRNETTADIKP
jgi:hypothetical protein